MTDKKPLQFYFSLPRVIAMLVGGNAHRSETNGLEALLVGLWLYAIHYVFFAHRLIPTLSSRLFIPLLLIGLVFGIWIFWLLLVYLNSLIIRLLRRWGLFVSLPDRRAQSILWGIVTTLMAGDIILSHPWLWQLAMIWLLALVLNLIAALVLSFSDAARGFDE